MDIDRPSHQIPNTAMILRSAIAHNAQKAIALHTKYQTVRSFYQDRSPFVVSDDRSPKMKERSPVSQEPRHTL